MQITGWTKPKHKCFASKAEALRWMSEDEDASNNSIRSPGNLPQLSPTIFEQAQRDKQHGISQLSSTIFEPSTADFGPYLSEVYSGGNYIQPSPTANKKRKISQPNGMHKTLKSNAAATASITDFDEADFEPGTAPLPPGTEDGYDPNLMLDPATGHIVYKTQEQRQATRIRPVGPSKTEPLRIYTDGSSLGNGTGGANAGVGIWFGPGDVRYFLAPSFFLYLTFCHAIFDDLSTLSPLPHISQSLQFRPSPPPQISLIDSPPLSPKQKPRRTPPTHFPPNQPTCRTHRPAPRPRTLPTKSPLAHLLRQQIRHRLRHLLVHQLAEK